MFELVSNEHLLKHNRRAADTLVRIKKGLITGLIVLGVAAVFLLPTETVAWVWGILLAVVIIGVVTVELLRARIFSRDVRQRSEIGPQE